MSDTRFPTRNTSPRYSTRSTTVRLAEDLLDRIAEVGTQEGLVQSDAIRFVLEVGLTKLGIKKEKGGSSTWQKQPE